MSDFCSKCERNHPTVEAMDALYDRIEALESCLRQAREALNETPGTYWSSKAREETIAAIDAALSGAPVKEE